VWQNGRVCSKIDALVDAQVEHPTMALLLC
jgi:hypothetical protein